MPPRAPAKRQRKIVISDDEAEPVPKSQKVKSRSTSTRGAQPSTPKKPKLSTTPKASPKSSPEKTRFGKGKDEKANKSLHSFFGKATEEQRWARTATAGEVVEDVEISDPIDDDFSDGALAVKENKLNGNRALDRRKALGGGSVKPRSGSSGELSSSQRFAQALRSEPNGASTTILPTDGYGQPWADHFSPKSLEELAVHKRKVKDVQDWLTAVFGGRERQRLLVLKGPAGSGKSTTVSLLSETLNISISQWRNPAVNEVGSSFSGQFEDFLETAQAFSSLGFSGETSDPSESRQSASSPARILLVDEFPSSNSQLSSTVISFRNTILHYLTVAVPPSSAKLLQAKTIASYPPLVLVITESLLTSATAAVDSFTAHRLLGPEICNHPYARVLEFNPIAPTLIAGALDLVMKKEAKISQRRRIPAPEVFKRLSSLGDIRSAINGLEFLCVRGDVNSDWGGRTAAKGKSAKNNTSLTKMEQDVLELITQREASLGIFHAVGKVIWNKREDSALGLSDLEPPTRPPDHLSHLHRPKTSKIASEELLTEIGTDIATFVAALHENYALSTPGPSFVDCAIECMEALSISDLLSPGSRQMTHTSGSSARSRGVFMQTGGVDMLRQNEISFQAAVRGLLFSLPSPVHRATHPSGKRGDSFKMFYPSSLKIWKETEEINDLVTLEMDRLSSMGVRGANHLVRSVSAEGGVETWGSRIRNFGPKTVIETKDEDLDPTSLRTWTTRDELLLDRLPYSTKICSLNKSDSSKLNQELRRVAHFKGRAWVNNDDEGDEKQHTDVVLDLTGADETTDRQPSQANGSLVAGRPGFRVQQAQKRQLETLELHEVTEEKLYLSDDDIED